MTAARSHPIAYFEIQAEDPSRCIAFYGDVFGWEFEQIPGLPIEYWRITTEGVPGAILQRPVPAPPERSGTNAFVCSLLVESFDRAAERILASGGRVAMEKFAVPGRCWQGYFLDPAGNTFGLFEPDDAAA